MVNFIISLFIVECVLFFYIFVYGIIFNILLSQNKNIIEKRFKELGYKLYIYDKTNGKIISRKMRNKVIMDLIQDNTTIKYYKTFNVVLSIYNSIYFVFGLMILFFFFLALILLIYDKIKS